MIPEVEIVGGFSLCSSPVLLRQQNLIQLAVQYNEHPPALWIHSKVIIFRCNMYMLVEFLSKIHQHT